MRLTILLPTHNRADTLEWALRSVAAQTESDFEVLICGDGCTDGTSRIALEWEKRDPRFQWFDLPKGPGFGYANRNLVLRQAQGEFIGFMAHDDLVFHDHFARMLEPMRDPAVQLVASRPLWVDDSGTLLPVANNLECSLVLEHFFDSHHWLPATCYLHRRAAFEEVGMWNADLPHSGDLDLWHRIVRHHGDDSVRYLTTPGALHFRALWKTAENKDPHSLYGWKKLLETPGAFPEILRSRLAENELPQANFGQRLLAADGVRWESEVRRAAELAIDSHAWLLKQSASKNFTRLAQLREQLAAARAQVVEQKTRAEKWKQKAATLRARAAAKPTARRWLWWKN